MDHNGHGHGHGQETGTIIVHNISYDLSKLSPHEIHRLKHEQMHEKHKGHESMHAEMVLILFGTLIVSQFFLVFWRTRHFKSFQVKYQKKSFKINQLLIIYFIHLFLVLHDAGNVDHSILYFLEIYSHKIPYNMDHIHNTYRFCISTSNKDTP